MADVYEYIDSTGVIIPDTSDILTGAQAPFLTAFGADMVMTTDTPQGVLAASSALVRTAVVKNNAAVANQFNPNESDGIFFDALMALTGQRRKSKTQTAVPNVILTGIPNTPIPGGVVVRTGNGDLFDSTGLVTLDSTGTATVNLIAEQYGPVPCPAGTLTIVQGPIGLETVTNPTAGVVGRLTQGTPLARAYRNNTLAFQGLSLAESITSALYATDGVTSLTFQENTAATTQTINGISMVSHSIYVCVAGGTDVNVAAALLENKSSGCAWNGGTTVNLVEPASGRTYAVQFDRPTQIGMLIKVTIRKGAPTDVINAVLDYASGNISGMPGFVVGGNVSPFEIAGAINNEFPAIYISNLQITPTTAPTSFTSNEYAIGVNQQAATQVSFITVVQA